jgi:2-methylcitrate dehydratase PrpD
MPDIVDFISDLGFEDIPEKTVHAARVCILDAVGCLAGGARNPAVYELAEKISKKNPGASIIAGTSFTSTRSWASFVNSHSCSYFDLDDGHRKAQGHPGGVIVPLSIMLAAENECTGKELIAAVVAGYETAVRSAQIIRQAGGPRKGSGGWSIIGGVAAAAKLCKLSKEELKNALGLAEYYAPQAPQDRSLAFPSSMKEGMAWAAHGAIEIVELAGLGFDGMSPFLCGAAECDDLGINWEICSTYFKMYACCRFSHPILDGLGDLVLDRGIDPAQIRSVKVVSFAKALLLDHLAPKNPVAAMYSIPFIVGCYLTRGKIGILEMDEKLLDDEEILEMAKKVVLEEDPELTGKFPLQCLARVSVTLTDGTMYASDTLSAKGDPAAPYAQEELREKFMDLVSYMPDNQGAALYDKIIEIDIEAPRDIWDALRQ